MKRTFAIILAVMAAAALFVGLVYAILVAAHISEPTATTVHGFTVRRLWATTAAMLGLVGLVSGGMAMNRAVRRVGNHGRRGAIVALVAGSIAGINGGLNLAVATGGPGTGNGVVGAAAAFVLGLVAMALGVAALARSRRIALGQGA
jgi:hypothetical protein